MFSKPTHLRSTVRLDDHPRGTEGAVQAAQDAVLQVATDAQRGAIDLDWTRATITLRSFGAGLAMTSSDTVEAEVPVR